MDISASFRVFCEKSLLAGKGMRHWWSGLSVLLGMGLLAGCASQLPPSQVHSVAYYAAQIPPPPAFIPTPVAPTQSAAPQTATLHIVVNADRRKLYLYRGSQLLASYPVAIGFRGSAPRRIRGDDKTPLGHYRIGYVWVWALIEPALNVIFYWLRLVLWQSERYLE